MSKIANLLILLTLATNLACAEDATAPVAPARGLSNGQNGTAGGEKPDADNRLELMALTYKGKDPFGVDCSLHISNIEDEHDQENHHQLVAKLGYNLHGEELLDTVVSFQRYDLDTNTYYSIDSNEGNTVPVIVSAVLDDEATVVDYNKLLEYEQSGTLVQSLRADLYDIDFATFEAALDEVLENESAFKNNKNKLDQLQRTVLKLAHAGHYDAVACSGFSLSGMSSVEFELDADHNDDDH